MATQIAVRRVDHRAHPAPGLARLRICHLGKFYPPASGGIETHLQTLAQAQTQLGQEVEVLCMNHCPGPTVREWDRGVRVTRFAPRLTTSKLMFSYELLRELRHAQADVLHVQVPNPTMIVACLLVRPQLPVVVTYQSDVVRQRLLNILFRPLEKVFYQRVRRILPTSPPYAKGSAFLRPYNGRIEVLPMGLDLEPYLKPCQDDRCRAEELRHTYPGPLWLACGRLIYYKGLLNGVQALARIGGTLVIVGDGPERASLEAESKRIGVANRVVFVGELPHLRIVPYYLAATAFWFPSNARSEAFGLVQVESMAAGCPVINTNIPGSGVPWVSRHEESGLTVPMDDPDALAAAARRLLDEPGLRDRLARTGRDRAMREFDWTAMARRSIDVYSRIVHEWKKDEEFAQ